MKKKKIVAMVCTGSLLFGLGASTVSADEYEFINDAIKGPIINMEETMDGIFCAQDRFWDNPNFTLTSGQGEKMGQHKKIIHEVKLLLPGGKATSAPPVGPALKNYGINAQAFLNEFNARSRKYEGMRVPAIITVYEDHSFTFIIKTPPIPVVIIKP